MSFLHFVGLVPGEVMVSDLSLTVGDGEIVSIPSDRALASRDLWRAVSQRLLYKVRQGARGNVVDPTVEMLERVRADLTAQVEGLQKANQDLRAQLERLQAQAPPPALAQDGRVEYLTGLVEKLLAAGHPGPAPGAYVAPADIRAASLAPEGAAPIFIPQFDVDSLAGRVSVKEEASSAEGAGGLDATRETLRKLRGKR